AVMLGKDFVSIQKNQWGDWDRVHRDVLTRLEQAAQLDGPWVVGESQARFERSPEELEIESFLESEIRPAVAGDGGDISLVRFEEGTVYVKLKGACSGCPSSQMTLKMGVEARLKERLPGVQQVVAL